MTNNIIEITDQDVIVKNGSEASVKVKLSDFLTRLMDRSNAACLPRVIPEGVRFIESRGEAIVVIVEQKPQVRSVRWISKNSKKDYGGAAYDEVRLAFPYIEIGVMFINGQPCGQQELYYRTAPVTSEKDELLLPNLLNVAPGYGRKCWLCLQYLDNVSKLPLNKKVESVVHHFWTSGFNHSCRHHEGPSWWERMVKEKLDPRVNSIDAWQKASVENPAFPLEVKWKPAGVSVKQLADSMLSTYKKSVEVKSFRDLTNLLFSCVPKQNRKKVGLGGKYLWEDSGH